MVVSYWAGEPYRIEAEALRMTLDSFSVPHVIERLPDTGRWETNCNLKAEFLIRMREAWAGPLVWLDADARVKGSLEPLDGLACDVGLHRFRGREVLSGTLLLNDTPGCRALLEEWAVECSTNPYEWDQRNLAAALKTMAALRFNPLSVRELGPEWCWVEGLSERYHKGVEPVIVQTQASRRLRT